MDSDIMGLGIVDFRGLEGNGYDGWWTLFGGMVWYDWMDVMSFVLVSAIFIFYADFWSTRLFCLLVWVLCLCVLACWACGHFSSSPLLWYDRSQVSASRVLYCRYYIDRLLRAP